MRVSYRALWMMALSAGVLASAATSAPAAPLFGITVDRVPHPERLADALAELPERPTTRIYYDTHLKASDYSAAVGQLGAVGGVLGELLDSSDERSISLQRLRSHVSEYLQTLGPGSEIWEVGNEVNGNWTGPYETVAAKLLQTYEQVAGAGGRTALTLYANDFGPGNCGDGSAELTPAQFTERYVPASVADGLDYVLLSYYPTECAGIEPSSRQLAAYLEGLHRLYSHAQLGFGEVGMPHQATARTLSEAKQIMSWAYSLEPGLSYYVGGYFWWYGEEDVLRPRAPLTASLGEAFTLEAAALG